MKTIALDEKTFEKLKHFKEELDTRSYREVIIVLMERAMTTPKSMFGIDKKLKPLTQKEHREFEKDRHGF
jgi:predicted CopG family antitoxin